MGSPLQFSDPIQTALTDVTPALPPCLWTFTPSLDLSVPAAFLIAPLVAHIVWSFFSHISPKRSQNFSLPILLRLPPGFDKTCTVSSSVVFAGVYFLQIQFIFLISPLPLRFINLVHSPAFRSPVGDTGHGVDEGFHWYFLVTPTDRKKLPQVWLRIMMGARPYEALYCGLTEV